MTRDFDDSWLPPLEPEDEGEDVLGGLAPDGSELGRTERRSGIRTLNIGPMARRVGGIVLVVLVGIAVWWGVQQLLVPPPAVPVPTGEWSPPTTEAPVVEATDTPVPGDPEDTPAEPTEPDEGVTFVPGQAVLVTGTDGEGISFRSAPGTDSVRIVILEEGARLSVLDGPDVADGYSWWHLETADGTSGWAAANWLTPAEVQ